MFRSILSLCAAAGLASAATSAESVPVAKRSVQALEGECSGGAVPSCEVLYWRYYFGRVVAADPVKAASYHLRMCDLGDAAQCGRYAGKVWLSKPGYPKNDTATVARYAKRGCMGGDSMSCGLAYTMSKKPNSYGAAERATVYRKLCQVRKPADCSLAADFEGEAGNNAFAMELARKACGRGDSRACINADVYAVRLGNSQRRAAAAARPTPPVANRPTPPSDAGMYQPSSGRRSNARDNSRSGTDSCTKSNGTAGKRYWYYGFDNQRKDGPCI